MQLSNGGQLEYNNIMFFDLAIQFLTSQTLFIRNTKRVANSCDIISAECKI